MDSFRVQVSGQQRVGFGEQLVDSLLHVGTDVRERLFSLLYAAFEFFLRIQLTQLCEQLIRFFQFAVLNSFPDPRAEDFATCDQVDQALLDPEQEPFGLQSLVVVA